MFITVIGILFVAIAGVLSFFHFCMLRAIRATSNIPHPPIVPIFGNAFEFGYTPVDVFKNMVRLFNAYSPIFQLWMGPVDVMIIIMDIRIIELILSSSKLIDKNIQYQFLKDWLGAGLLLGTGDKWRKMRKILTPAFHFSNLEKSVNTFTSSDEVLIKKLLKHSDGEVFDIYPYISLCALDIVCESAMGIKLNAQLNSNSEYVSAVREVLDIVHNRMFSVLTRSQLIFDITPQGRRFKNRVKFLHSVTDGVIQTRRDLLTNQKIQKSENDLGTKQRPTFLDVLLQSTVDGKPLTNAEIREEVDTLMFAGHDTVSSAIAFALYLLANNPEIQDKLFTEICDNMEDDRNKSFKYSNFQTMTYLDAVIKETLRLYPSVPIIGRQLTHNLEIRNQIVSKGTNIIIPAFIIQRNPDLFPEPEKFLPERFLDNNVVVHQKAFQYIPFSAGVRNCIGQKFAILEMKSVICSIMRHYELLSAGRKYEPQLIMAIVLKSNNGVHIKIKPRIY